MGLRYSVLRHPVGIQFADAVHFPCDFWRLWSFPKRPEDRLWQIPCLYLVGALGRSTQGFGKRTNHERQTRHFPLDPNLRLSALHPKLQHTACSKNTSQSGQLPDTGITHLRVGLDFEQPIAEMALATE